jgi:hypothetical protein
VNLLGQLSREPAVAYLKSIQSNKRAFFGNQGGTLLELGRVHLNRDGCCARNNLELCLSALGGNLTLTCDLSFTGGLALLAGSLSLTCDLSFTGGLALLGGRTLLTGLGFSLAGNLSLTGGLALLGASLSFAHTADEASGFAELDGEHQELTHLSILSGQGSNHFPDGGILLGHLDFLSSESFLEFSGGKALSQSCERFA